MTPLPFRLASIAAVLAFAGCATSTGTAPASPLKKPELDQIAAQQQGRVPASFAAFLAQVAQDRPALAPLAQRVQRREALTDAESLQAARLLGLHNRLSNQAGVIDATARMVALPTVRGSMPPHEDPQIIAFGQLLGRMATDFGLQYRNVDNRVFEVRLAGSGGEEFGILTHADVVPVVASEWVLEDGTRLDPFKLTRVGGPAGDLLYGRGSIDDKGSIATVLYAMKAVKDSGLPLARTIRLMVDTTEETGGDAIRYYQQRTQLPQYNIVLDSRYPAVVAEKGTGALRAGFAVGLARPAAAGAATITALAGAASANAIPQTATARLQAADPAALASRLKAAATAFVQQYTAQGKFAIEVAPRADGVDIKVTGTSAHGSRPEEGVNPLPRLALFLQTAGVPLADNGYAQATRYIADLFGLDYLGNRMGLAYADSFMGPLTASPTLVRENAGKVEVTANVRMPRGNTPEALSAATQARVRAWGAANGIAVEVAHTQGNWMARDPKGAWLATLLNIFGDTTGLPAAPVSTAGSTTAKQMPNAINFGPAMPGKKYTAHNANEFKEVADLDADMQMFTEMLLRIGNLPQMQ
ncbi:dipeptidase [Pseudorhodoferax sp. Leaf274]|uniref:dipeptidase n=1 Tax=Pseudorhodoferax sp. Leaf274 TaxID=1736318 RepID=UPI0007026DC4|nr:dipeptidase [Pseudorhodoferax sp. Leaf274]KQP37539.1 beta-Ala-Xaa dipeptidase [Pseudorhodoferax sp. Leaf274]